MPRETPTELPKAYDPALIEEKWAKHWADEHLFDVATPAPPGGPSVPPHGTGGIAHTPGAPSSPEASSPARVGPHTAKPFVQLLPPPNVTGRLHMGHMLNHTEMDILARWHRMLGDTTVWVPGTDHAGIATQMMVERQLAAEGKKRTDFTREQFTERVWDWKQQYGGYITTQMRRLGATVDWSREYFTMDDRLSRAVKEAFVRLYNQGLIYRGAYIVNWDPTLGTAVSDLEVDNAERAGHLYHVRYDLADGPASDGTASITIATTRPETMLGDTAVAVNPTDERYKHLIGKNLVLPLSAVNGESDRHIPIVADDWANPEFGTGAVKVTPAHDPNDFAIGQRHNLPQPSIMDKNAHIHLPGSPYHGLDRFEARKQIVADLEASGHLVSIKDHTLTLPISQRTGVIIEPRLSMQWFLAVNKEPQTPGAPSSSTASSSTKVGTGEAGAATNPGAPGLASETWVPTEAERAPNSIAAKAIAAVREGHIRFTPEMYAKTYFEWMNNLHDWCISRQLWWGHRIPAWYCGACDKMTVTLDPSPACHGCGITDIKQETDVLDTWFSSGLLPFTVFGWPGTPEGLSSSSAAEGSAVGAAITPDLAAFYPTQLLVTGFDILFFWVARMIMLSTHFMLEVPMPDGSKRELKDAVPFRNVYIHALVRDANREKMSKTKGNVIDPIGIVEKYGTDAVRFTLASQASPGTDIAFNEQRTEGYRAFANKIWNAARFIQMNIDRGREAGYRVTLGRLPDMQQPPLETCWMLSRVGDVSVKVELALKAYRFDEAANAIYQFFWGEFCDWYLELVKLRLNFDVPVNAQTEQTLNALVNIFETALRLLSPFMPFLTEELWHALYAQVDQQPPSKSIALASYPRLGDFPDHVDSEFDMESLQELIVTIRGLRKDLAVPEKEPTPIQLYAANPAIGILAQSHADTLARMARVGSVAVVSAAPTGANARSTPSFDVAVLYERQIDVPAERERLTKELAKLNKGIEAADKQLNNEGFISRAPTHIVDGLKKQSAETRTLKEKAEATLAALPPL